jgi:hypothetical protein
MVASKNKRPANLENVGYIGGFSQNFQYRAKIKEAGQNEDHKIYWFGRPQENHRNSHRRSK